MKITVNFTRLKALADSFGKQDVAFNLELAQYVFEPIDYALVEGIQIPPEDIEVQGGLLSYKGRQVLLYIKDHSYGNIYQEAISRGGGNRFHVANCKTLEQMMSRGRHKRYMATANLSGEFVIGATGRPDAKAKLQVCLNCLDLLNYQQIRVIPAQKKLIVEKFRLTEFFATYSSFFKFMPHYNEATKIGYTSDWDLVSKDVREKARYICNDCSVNLSENKSLCHTHHINGVKNDNSFENLQVLCADCHRRAHGGSLYVKYSDMAMITYLRKKQGVLSNADDWDKVLSLVDPALSGELGLLRQRGMKAPQLGVEVNGVTLDVAWPTLKKAISVEKVAIAGWDLQKPGREL